MAQRQHLDRDADLDPSGPAGDGGGHGERRGEHRAVLLEVELREPDGVEAEGLRREHLGHRLLERRGLARPRRTVELREQAELHAASPSRIGRPRGGPGAGMVRATWAVAYRGFGRSDIARTPPGGARATIPSVVDRA